MSEIKKIGNITLEYLEKIPKDDYQDDAEEYLFELFKSAKNADNLDKLVSDTLKSKPSWAIYYHLTPYRHNLLNFYEFENGSSVLEIGAGCGAITEGLLYKDIKLTGIELTEKRSLINAYRNKYSTNKAKIIVGNLYDLSDDKKYDYIVCVGVLEYAGTFIDSINPYNDFLNKIKELLKPGGRLLLAIENRLGLKYWSGAKEDHTNTFFEGLNSYPSDKKVQTFGKKELEDLINSTGLKVNQIFYPFPDYKTPQFIYSDQYYPGKNTTFPLGRLPTPTLDRKRETFFSEQTAMMALEKNDLFREFSNSFLVEAIS